MRKVMSHLLPLIVLFACAAQDLPAVPGEGTVSADAQRPGMGVEDPYFVGNNAGLRGIGYGTVASGGKEPELGTLAVPGPATRAATNAAPAAVPSPQPQMARSQPAASRASDADAAARYRARLSELDPIVVTDNRAPRAATAAERPASPAASRPQPRPIATASEYSGDVAPRTVSVMAPPAPTPAVAVGRQPAPMPVGNSAPSIANQYEVHLASYRGNERAVEGWEIFRDRYPETFRGLSARSISVDIPGKGRYVRLLAGPFSSAGEAAGVCTVLEQSDDYCKVMPPGAASKG